MHIAYWRENQKERDHCQEDQDVGGRIMKRIFEIGSGGTDWIDMAQDRGQWRALVNRVKSLQAL
jgi:hypothetical protein